MKVQTTRFGPVEVEQQRVLEFPAGLLGFPQQKKYVLLQTNDEGNFFWLQSVDNPAVAFVVCDPLLFAPDYQVPARTEEFRAINLERVDEAQVFVIVNKVDTTLTGNLQGPLVVSASNRKGVQLVLSEKKYSTRHPLIRLHSQARQVSKTA